MPRREIPAGNLCRIRASTEHDINRPTYNREIAEPIGDYLKKHKLVESVLYIVTAAGVPLRIEGSGGIGGNAAAVDSELLHD